MKDLECFNTPHKRVVNSFPQCLPSVRPPHIGTYSLRVTNIFFVMFLHFLDLRVFDDP